MMKGLMMAGGYQRGGDVLGCMGGDNWVSGKGQGACVCQGGMLVLG